MTVLREFGCYLLGTKYILACNQIFFLPAWCEIFHAEEIETIRTALLDLITGLINALDHPHGLMSGVKG